MAFFFCSILAKYTVSQLRNYEIVDIGIDVICKFDRLD